MSKKLEWANAKRKLSELIPWPRNPRKIGAEQTKRLNTSLLEFAQVETIAIGPGNEVYNGHQRLTAWAEEYGDIEVDVRVANRALTEKEREKLTVFLHKGAAGEWDFDKLADFDVADLTEWGFDASDLANCGFDAVESVEVTDVEPQIDKAEELREKWGVESGQLWKLGDHRLLCGDSTKAEDVARIMGGDKAHACVTDVPYGISQQSNGLRRLDYGEWDKGNATENAFNALSLCADVPTITAFCGDEQLSLLFALWHNRTKRTVVWVKPNPTVINGDHIFLPACELAAYGRLPGAWFGGKCVRSVWEGTAPSRRNHPTQKPIELIKWIVSLTCDASNIVYDPFVGSGTTIISAEQLNRRCYAIEISPAYCAVTLQRWADATGKIPVLLE